MSLFVIGDPHLSFSVDKPMDIFRGWTDYTDRIKKNWNNVVGENDSVVIPGDVSWAMNFDDAKKEYVITRPDTPAPWANYLGSPEYGAIISNNAGGYSFAKSGANGRILRYIFTTRRH